MTKIKSGLLFLLLVLATTLASAATSEQRLLALGISAAKQPFDSPDFELQDVNGKTHSPSDYKGKVVFLNFWATWCPPCRSEMPAMQRLSEELQAAGLEILAVDLREDAETVRKFMEKNEFTFTALLDTTGRVGGQYGAANIPTTYLIDRNGQIFARAVGALEWDSRGVITVLQDLLESGYIYEDGIETTADNS